MKAGTGGDASHVIAEFDQDLVMYSCGMLG